MSEATRVRSLEATELSVQQEPHDSRGYDNEFRYTGDLL